jgi:polyphosphate glucokinase
MVAQVKRLTKDWKFDVIAVGYPGTVLHDRPITEPHNLGAGWVGFNFRAAFRRPVRIINDAAMQALGGYRRGKMLFLGLGRGLDTALIVDGIRPHRFAPIRLDKKRGQDSPDKIV